MDVAPERPNVELRPMLRDGSGSEKIVVLAFPYDEQIVRACRAIPGRRFDWDAREWSAPLDDWVGAHVAGLLEQFPELTTSSDVDAWLKDVESRWIGTVSTVRHDGRGWWRVGTRAGKVPEALQEGAVPAQDALLVPFSPEGAETLREQRSARIDAPGVALHRLAARRRGPAGRAADGRRGRQGPAAQARGAVGPRRG